MGCLIAWFFKIDQLVASSPAAANKPMLRPRVDVRGIPLCIDPDGRIFVPVVKRIPETNTTQVVKFVPERRRNSGELCFHGVDRRAFRLAY